MDLDQCICSGKSLPKLLRPAILALLAENSAHGYQLLQQLRELKLSGAGSPDTSGVYKILRQMESEELIIATWDLGESGPARRRYELTSKGRACLERWAQTLADYQSQVAALLSLVAPVNKPYGQVAEKKCRCRQLGKKQDNAE